MTRTERMQLAMTMVNVAIKLSQTLKHGDHDQSTHGNRGGGASAYGNLSKPTSRQINARPDSYVMAQNFEDAKRYAVEAGFPEERFLYEEKEYKFVVNGRQCTAAGTYTPGEQIIRMYDPGLEGASQYSLKTIVNHEVAHYKFDELEHEAQELRNEMADEDFEAVREAYPDRFLPDGRPTTPAQIKHYPALYVTRAIYKNPESNAHFRKLRTGDGVTPYSRDYWKQFEKQGGTDPRMRRAAINETLAEIAGYKAANGGEWPPDTTEDWKVYYDAFDRAFNKIGDGEA